jgi:hypothetical protein
MNIWVGRFLFGFGVFLGIFGAIVRRLYDSEEFIEVFGVGRWSVIVVFVIALAFIGAGYLILKKLGDMK